MARIEREMGSGNIVRNLDNDDALESFVRDNYDQISKAVNDIEKADIYTELRVTGDTMRSRREIDEDDTDEFYNNMFSSI